MTAAPQTEAIAPRATHAATPVVEDRSDRAADPMRSPATRDLLRRLARTEPDPAAASPAVVDAGVAVPTGELVVATHDSERRVRRHFVHADDSRASDLTHGARDRFPGTCFRHPGPWTLLIPGTWGAWCEPWIVVYDMPLSWRGLFEDDDSYSFEASTTVEGFGDSIDDWIAWFMELGDALFRAGFYRTSALCFEWAVRLDPDLAGPRFALVDALFATGDYAYAAVVLRVAAELDPGWLDLEIDRAAFYGNLDDHAEHAARLAERVRENPFDLAALQLLGYERFFSITPESSREVWHSVLDDDPHDALAIAFLDALDRRLFTP